jgi:molybdopterin-binding protein
MGQKCHSLEVESQSSVWQKRTLEQEDIMKLSTRNVIKGRVVEVKEGQVAAKVKVDIGGGNFITSTITVDAVRELELKVGDDVCALIKASSVMIGK